MCTGYHLCRHADECLLHQPCRGRRLLHRGHVGPAAGRFLPRLGRSPRRPDWPPARPASGTRTSPCAASSSGRSPTEQVPVAVAMEPDVITLVGGLNDTLRPKCDMGRVRGLLEEAVERLAPALQAAGADAQPRPPGPGHGALPAAHGGTVRLRRRPRVPARRARGRPVRGRRRSATRGMWDVDRLHLTAEGHRRVAEAVWQTLGHEAEDPDWHTPVPADGTARLGRPPRRGRPLRPAVPAARGSAAA